jgi:GNAT superfamily N-acetyltransferase
MQTDQTLPPTISPVYLPAPALEPLAAEARAEGHALIDRLIAEWDSGANRFDRPGERLLAAWQDDSLVAVGGLNRDPYADDDRVGRLRHLYVRASWRRSGLGGQLAATLIAGPHPFATIRLRTTNPAAAQMYEYIGFAVCDTPDATHVLECLQHR